MIATSLRVVQCVLNPDVISTLDIGVYIMVVLTPNNPVVDQLCPFTKNSSRRVADLR